MTSMTIVGSREHSPLQTVEETLRLATKLARYIENLVDGKQEAPLLDLLSELYSIIRILFHLMDPIQGEPLVDQEDTTLTILSGPTESLQQFLLLLRLLISTFSSGRAQRELELRHAAKTFNVICITRRCEKQKIDLLSALPKDHQLSSPALEDSCIPRLYEQGGEVTSGQAVEVYPREQVFQWLLGNRVALDDPETVTLPVSGTGRWLLQSKEFEAWKTAPQSVLWLYGIAGSGKTTLCASVVEHMILNNTPSDALAYFFFSPKQGVAGNYTRCLRSLVTQLDNASRRPRGADLTLHSSCPFSDHAAYQSILLEKLQGLILKRKTFIILDGIDEAQDKKKIMELLSIFGNKQLGNLHLLISSRPETKIIKALDPMVVATMGIEGWALNEDISVYIEHYFRISSTTKTWQESSKRRTRDWLVSEAAGRFDWITFCLVLLERFPELETNIQSLPKSMPGIFDRLLSGIPAENGKEAHLALQWLAFAERPLYSDELAQATFIGSKPEGDLSTPLPTSYAIDDICLGLTTSIPMIEDGIYRKKIVFAHHSLRDYLMSGGIESPRAAIFGVKETDAQLMICRTSLDYYLSSILYDPSPLHYASCHGWKEMVRILISKAELDKDALWSSNFLGTALQAASYRGHYGVSEMLLRAGAAVNPAPGFYGNPVHAAACDGHANLIELLIEFGADIDAKGGVYGNALVAAANGGHQAAVNKLTENGAELNAEGSEDYPTALYAASLNGHREVVARLLHWGADPNKEYAHGKFALRAAVHKGYEDIVAMLIEHGAFLDRECEDGLNIGNLTMHMAAKGGYEGLVYCLLTWPCINADSPNGEGLSPLLIAASHGHTDIVQLLLENGRKSINTRARDRSGSTALMIAVSHGYMDIVRIILEHCARRAETQTYNQGLRSLMMAVSGGNQGLVLLLLEHGVKAWEPVNSWHPRDGQIKTPLITAIETGHEAITFLLLQHGAKIDDTDRPENKPMDMAVSKGYRTIEKLLSFGDGEAAIADRDRWWKTVSRVKDEWN